MTSTNTRPLDLNAIETRVNAASKGPWTLAYAYCDCSEDCGHGLYVSRINTGSGPATELCDLPRAEWELMVHAREDIDALVAEVRRLQRQRKYLIDQLAKRDAESGRGGAALREFLAASDPICGDPNDGDWCELEPGHAGHHQADTAEWAQHPTEDASTPV